MKISTRTKAVVVAVGLALTGSVLLAPQASADLSSYTILRSTAAYLTAGNNLWPAGVDDAVKKVTLPFPVKLYGSKDRTWVWVSSNGNLQFGNTPNATWSNYCLPSRVLSGPSVLVYWDDILIRQQSLSGDGVFTKKSGLVGKRKFIISWKGVLFDSPDYPIRAEIIFFENKPYFETRYAAGDGASATIGIENYYFTDYTTWSCQDALKAPDPGQSLRFTYTP